MLPSRLPSKSAKAEPGRRSPAHRKWVRGHHCCVPGCKQMPIECAHVRNGTDGGLGMKPSDRWTVSLCKDHHAEQHRIGEPQFEARYAISLKALAEEFFRKSPHRKVLA